MVINFALAAGTVVLSLLGDPAVPVSRIGRHAPVAEKIAAVDPFNPPPKVRKRRPAGARPSQNGAQPDTNAADETEEEAPAPPPRRQSPPPSRRRPSAAENAESEDSAAQADDEDEEGSKGKRKLRRRAADEEEEDEEAEDAPFASLPVILPRLISFQGGASAIGRSFQYNAALQKENTFPRTGLTLTLESFPLLRMPHGWWKTFGVGISVAMEFGAAAGGPQPDGSSNTFPVRERRWSVDVRYAIPVGARLIVIPALGYGSIVFDMKTLMPIAPSACSSATTPCLADVDASDVIADLHLRLAATSDFALSLSGGYFIGVSVSKKVGQIGSERPATTLSGFHVELGANLMLKDWLALRLAVPVNRYSYSFNSGGPGTYSAATETYYGLALGAMVFLP